LNYYETASGLKFILNTEINTPVNPREVLHQVYEKVSFALCWQTTFLQRYLTPFAQVLLPYVIKNPTGNLDEQIKNELFDSKLDEYVKQSPIY
jgi:hypothetical protein